jgi:hypothetical protein
MITTATVRRQIGGFFKFAFLSITLQAFVLHGAGANDGSPGHGDRARRVRTVMTDIGPNSQTFQRFDADDGTPQSKPIVTLSTGMNYWTGTQYSPSDPTFEAVRDGFLAGKVQSRIHLGGNINMQGAVRVTTRDGYKLSSTPAAIALYNKVSGDSLIIGTITNSIGVLVGTNCVIYPEAFTGVCADVIYSLERQSFCQDVVITGRFDPSDWGFPAESTQIQIISRILRMPGPGYGEQSNLCRAGRRQASANGFAGFH